MHVEDLLCVTIEQGFAGFQPFRGFGSEHSTVKIKLFYFFKPALQLFQLDVVLFQLVVSEVLRGCFLCDLGFEIVAFVDEFAVGIVAIDLKASDNLALLQTVERYGREEVLSAIKAIMDQSEAMARARTRSIPDGTYEAESYMDDDGIDVGKKVPIKVKVTDLSLPSRPAPASSA